MAKQKFRLISGLLLLLLLSTKMIKVAENQKTSRTPNSIRQCHSSDISKTYS